MINDTNIIICGVKREISCQKFMCCNDGYLDVEHDCNARVMQ